MIIELILFVLGIFLLIKSAGWLVSGASSLAKKLGISTLIIGLTIVAFGTSMPELIVNILAAINKAGEISFGNIIGSNISNILLILGITAIIGNIDFKDSTRKKEIPFALISVVILFILSNKIISGTKIPLLTRTDGLMLLLLFGFFLYYIFKTDSLNKAKKKKEKRKIPKISNKRITLLILSGIIGLYFGGKFVVEGAMFIAQSFGISQFLISATIIAIGTSLPEIVVSVTAALKKDMDLAVGNIVGSNIFNILWILGLTSLIAPIKIPSFINLDLIILLVITLLLFLFVFINKKQKIKRKHGILFILLYLIYLIFLILRG
jgi:cation:H+ antiporter